MKIATVTYHDGINFGAFWQASCLAQYLKEEGHDVYITNYKPKSLEVNELKTLFYTKNLFLAVKNVVKFFKFRSFQKGNFKLIEGTRFKEEGIELLVFGSDEIWNFTNPLIGLDENYFGAISSSIRKISYAPSFGTVCFDDMLPDDVLNNLKSFSNISVRDINSEKIIEKNLGISVPIVCDPVFLSDIPFNYKSEYKNSIIIYSTGLPKEFLDKVIEYGNKNGLEIIAIGYNIKGIKSIIGLSPSEFIDIFSSANMIITSMFHGVMFSLKFRKQFVIYEDAYRNNKLSHVVEEFTLRERYISERNFHDVISSKLDYEVLDGRIDSWVDKSKLVLNGMIK